MELINIIDIILTEQLNSHKPITVDIQLKNGNIIIRSFQILNLDKKNHLIKGLTFQEEYIHARENRNPIFCVLKINEIKELSCDYLDMRYSENPLPLSKSNI